MGPLRAVFIALLLSFMTSAAAAQQTPPTGTVTCSFNGDKEVTAEYQKIPFNREEAAFRT